MEFYLVSDENEIPAGTSVTPVRPCCCIGIRLCCRKENPAGGWLMVLPGTCIGEPEPIARDLLRMCLKNGYGGVILDFPRDAPSYRELAEGMVSLLREYNIQTAVPCGYASGDLYCVPTATVSGNFRENLTKYTAQYGAKRILLDLERVRRDYLLPCPRGEGRPLSSAAFRQLLEGVTCYYSRELAQRYFTYRRGQENHFVIFDDRDTLRCKLETAQSLGIEKALVFYGEMQELWPLEK